MQQPFELLSHTADLKIRAYASSLPELFSNVLLGMFSAVRPKAHQITYKGDVAQCPSFTVHRDIMLRAPNKEQLLIDFLSECLYLSDVHNEAYLAASFDDFSEKGLEATIHGIEVVGFDVVEIKAVTYHDLVIEQKNGTWQATIVFDI